jgi:lipooligosaccharide transport system ATP-binding protein
MAAAEALIHARGLTKRFGGLTAVDGIDFDVDKGEAFGFLGPNGAGKSSTMRMIGSQCARTASSTGATSDCRDARRVRAPTS